MNGQPPNDDVLLMVFLLACAFLTIFYLVDRWRDSTVAEVWRTVYADFRRVRAQRRAERMARREVDRFPNVVVRIARQWEAKR